MALPMNHDFTNLELSIEELDAVAAGGWLGNAASWVGHEVNSFFTNPVVAGLAGAIVVGGGLIALGGPQLRQD